MPGRGRTALPLSFPPASLPFESLPPLPPPDRIPGSALPPPPPAPPALTVRAPHTSGRRAHLAWTREGDRRPVALENLRNQGADPAIFTARGKIRNKYKSDYKL